MSVRYPINPTANDRFRYSWSCFDAATKLALLTMSTYAFAFPRICDPDLIRAIYEVNYPEAWEKRFELFQRYFQVRTVTRVIPGEPPEPVTGFDCVGNPVGLLTNCNISGGCTSLTRSGCREDFPINKPNL